MLRISHVADAGQAATLKLEGKLMGPWVDELRETCRSHACQADRIRLDLSAVTFVDAAGARLLRDLVSQGTQIIACSGYLAELLHVEQR